MVRKLFTVSAAAIIICIALRIACAAQTPPATTDAAVKTLKFAIVADNHFYFPDSKEHTWSADTYSAMKKYFKLFADTIKPEFVVYLGDQISGEGTVEITEEQSYELTRLFIEEAKRSLKVPFHSVWGNHDGPNFPKIYGYKNKAFSHGGYLFYLMGIELTNYWSGVGKFEDWKFFEDSLKAAPDETALVFIHEPIFSPTFENALKVKKFIEKFPQVKIVFQGHTHSEMLNVSNGVTYFTCAGFLMPAHPFYIVEITSGNMKVTRYDLVDGEYKSTEVFERDLNAQKRK